jgi:hypothetical protein
LEDNTFELLAHGRGGEVITVKYKGVYVIVDNGYLNWSCTVPPFTVMSNDVDEIRWSKWTESMRKDVECTFDILNSLTPKSIPAGTKLVLFDRYVLNIHVGIVRYFLCTTKLSVPKSTYRHNAQIGEYRTI